MGGRRRKLFSPFEKSFLLLPPTVLIFLFNLGLVLDFPSVQSLTADGTEKLLVEVAETLVVFLD